MINLGLWIACIMWNSGCCRSVAPWIPVLSRHNSQRGWFTNLHFCDFPRNKAPRTGPRHIWHTCKLCPFFGHEKNTDGSGDGWMFSLACVCYGDSRFAKHFLRPHLVLQPDWGWGDLGSFQRPQSHSSPEGSWNIGGLYLAPHEDNSIQLLSVANNYNGLPYILCVTGTISETCCHWGMDVFYSNSKTDLKLRCEYCIKFQLFESAQDVFSRLTAVCCMLLQHNPHRLTPSLQEAHLWDLE